MMMSRYAEKKYSRIRAFDINFENACVFPLADKLIHLHAHQRFLFTEKALEAHSSQCSIDWERKIRGRKGLHSSGGQLKTVSVNRIN